MANSQTKRKKKHFCPLPFLSLHLLNEGKAYPCCLRLDYALGFVKDGNFDNVWNSDKMRALRREFLSGNPTTCANEIRQSSCHSQYDRLLEHVVREERQTKPPRVLSAHLNGQCNLECVMCEIWSGPNAYYDTIDFWSAAPAEVFPHLLEIKLLGGEPFIQKDTYRLIKEISAVNSKCLWSFVTNGHWKLNPFVKEQLDRITLNHIDVSIDSMDPEGFARIRKNGNLGLALQTLNDLRAYSQERETRSLGGFSIALNMVVQIGNEDQIGAFLAYAREKNVGAVLSFLEVPPALSLSSLEERKKIETIDRLIELYRSTRENCIYNIIFRLGMSLRPTSLISYAGVFTQIQAGTL